MIRLGAFVALAVVIGSMVACGGGGKGATASPAATTAGGGPGASAEERTTSKPLARKMATLYFPSSSTGLLAAESREILATRAAEDRAKQILSDLMSGPTQAGLEPAVPAGTRLLQVYVLRDGTAYADFSAELRSAIEPGSDNEIATVYSIVNSLTINIPEIDRVGILIEGRPCPNLNGHLDLRHPLRPDWRTVETGEPEEAPAATPGGGQTVSVPCPFSTAAPRA